MKLLALFKTLRKLIQIFEKEKIDYMLIGGLALPAYGEIRTTQDLDVAISIGNIESLRKLVNELEEKKFEPTSKPDLEAAMFYAFDRENVVDVEIWLRPDGIVFDEELLRRRTRRTVIDDLSFWVIGLEDFIVNKLARKDRRSQDEIDVVSVIELQKEKLDKDYLYKRAENAGVLLLLKALEKKIKQAKK